MKLATVAQLGMFLDGSGQFSASLLLPSDQNRFITNTQTYLINLTDKKVVKMNHLSIPSY